jgi:hypothetical protein
MTKSTESPWTNVFKDAFYSVRNSLPVVLECESCRELWLQGELFRAIRKYDHDFSLNTYKIAPRKKADFHGCRSVEMVGELKVYGYSGFYNKNLFGRSNITDFIPKNDSRRIMILPEHERIVNQNESNIFKDYFRLKAINNNAIIKVLVLVIWKNGQKDGFGQAISAIKFSAIEAVSEYPKFIVKIWQV